MERLTRGDILRALQRLSLELTPEEPPDEIVLVGGAAIVALYGARETTKDVDAIVMRPERAAAVRAAAGRIAAELGLPEDWLNDAAKGYAQGLTRGDEILRTASLVVRAAATPQLLAMKLSAWRDDLDVNDARLLLSQLDGDREAIWERVEPYVVPGRELKARYAFDDLWETDRGPA